jgi:hypothetical protein
MGPVKAGRSVSAWRRTTPKQMRPLVFNRSAARYEHISFETELALREI